MFTGLIEDVGSVVGLVLSGESGMLTVKTSLPTAEIRLGDSVAVNGVCLTVTRREPERLTFDVSSETLDRSVLGGFKSGAKVNLERALRLSDRLGGHIVTGHVDCIARLEAQREHSNAVILTFRLLDAVKARYVVPKGSIAIDGISLTVNECSAATFSVTIIPHTAVKTTLVLRNVGEHVNIETDIIGKYVEQLMAPAKDKITGGVTAELLSRNGFL